MGYNLVAPANRLVAILAGLAGIGGAQLGVPTTIGPRVYAYVTVAGMTVARKATGIMFRDARYRIGLTYRIDATADVPAAETTLMGLIDAFLIALQADLTLAGSCEAIEVDAGLADGAEYQIWAGKEFREWPVVVTARQYATHNH